MTLSSQLLPGVPLVESPLFAQSLDEMGLTPQEREIAIQLNERGYAVLDFPDEQIDSRIDRVKVSLAPRFDVDFSRADGIKNTGNLRIQDAWKYDEDVRAIAANSAIRALLSKLYGRRAFPFQTLNFPVGTQQHMHSDSVHFSSIPERFMCGVWLAMEDITDDTGPLLYYPGSHKWPILTNEMLARRGSDNKSGSAQTPYETVWRAMTEATGIPPEIFCAKKGQALIWAANLLHGGSPQSDLTRTRWSQVTHYYFADCIYYTPTFSDAALGQLDMRSIINVENGKIEPNIHVDREIAVPNRKDSRLKKLGSLFRRPAAVDGELPADFDEQVYYRLNTDVAASGADARRHYLCHGQFEQRRYKL